MFLSLLFLDGFRAFVGIFAGAVSTPEGLYHVTMLD